MKRGALPLVAVIALGVSGCGGHQTATSGGAVSTSGQAAPPVTRSKTILTKPAYERTMRTLGHRLSKSIEALYPLDVGQVGSGDSKASAAKLTKALGIVAGIDRDLSRINPPTSISSEHIGVLHGVQELESELNQLITAVERGSTHSFASLTQLAGLTAIATATSAIRARGYAIG